ncbi:MAG: response regulator [Candidatus Acidiferrum sp.]
MPELQVVSIPIFPSFGDPKDVPGRPHYRGDEEDRLEKSKKIKVIVVDDEALIADTVAEILNEEGFEAKALSTGDAAIELAKTWHPDFVLSDVIMPGLNGIETGIRIREAVPNCKIILFSGQAATVNLLERAREQGHKFHIVAKPIKPEQLIFLIRSSLGSVC